MNTIRIGLAGFGTVGSALYRRLQHDGDLLFERCKVRPIITAIAVKNSRKSRKTPLSRSLLVSRPEDLVASKNTDIIVELMGGCDTAENLILSSLRAGKPVVTANKALLAERGSRIFGEANRRQVPIYFEASVCGGIPIIKALREGLIGNRFQLIYGIFNGTCNYILTRMSQEKMAFHIALRQAQELGYAEQDPTFDINGLDAAHKATVLASLAYGGIVDFRQVHVEGIGDVTAVDVQFAQQMGYEIKLLAIIRMRQSLEVRVHPTLIPRTNRLASIHGVTNAIVVRGHAVGDIEFSGPGAGGEATASAVLSDIADAARRIMNLRQMNFKKDSEYDFPCINERGPPVVPIDSIISRYYLRLSVVDRPGVMAQISSILGQAKIGISSIFQPEGHEGSSVPLIFMIHDARDEIMQRALRKIQRLKCVKAKPVILRVESFDL